MKEEGNKIAIEKNLEAFRKLSESINAQMKPFMNSTDFYERFEKAFEPARMAMEKFQQWNEVMLEKLKPTLEAIRKIQENHKEGKEIRGDIVTSVIDLDYILEEIIVKKYVKPELQDEFIRNMLNDEGCSSFLKMKVVFRSGLLDKGLKTNIQTLLETRNIVAHSKYIPTVQTVVILQKDKIADLQTLKNKFDLIFRDSMNKLNEISRNI